MWGGVCASWLLVCCDDDEIHNGPSVVAPHGASKQWLGAPGVGQLSPRGGEPRPPPKECGRPGCSHTSSRRPSYLSAPRGDAALTVNERFRRTARKDASGNQSLDALIASCVAPHTRPVWNVLSHLKTIIYVYFGPECCPARRCQHLEQPTDIIATYSYI